MNINAQIIDDIEVYISYQAMQKKTLLRHPRSVVTKSPTHNTLQKEKRAANEKEMYIYQGCSRGRDLRDQDRDRDVGGRDQDRDRGHLN